MKDTITRRDFMNGVALAVTGVGSIEWSKAHADGQAAATAGNGGDYPPTRSGLRGSHAGSFEAAHRLRDGMPFDLTGAKVEENYDLVIVGAGISGLASAHFYRQRKPNARILILDTNDDFGGHAKRNEFEVDGKMILGYGGTQSIDSPKHKWSKVARGVLKDLGIETTRFNTAFDQGFYDRWNLKHAVYFDADHFGADRLVRQPFGGWQDWDEQAGDPTPLHEYIAQMPINERAKQQLTEMFLSDRDVLKGSTLEQRRTVLEHTSYSDFLKRYWDADADILKLLQKRTHGLWAIGIDAVPVSEAMDLPGLKAQRAALAAAGKGEEFEPYIYHFPDGNASIARMLVRRLIPGIAPGSTMEDIVRARFDYSQLDKAQNAVRIRLSSTAVDVRNVDKGVQVAYVRDGKPERVAARDCILACYHAMVPYITPETDARQRAALHENVRAPLVYVNVIARNWQAWHKLGVGFIANAGGMFDAYLDFPVSLDGYHFSADPSQPICIHLEYMPCAPNQGLNMREQYRIGRSRLYGMTFADFEKSIRTELTKMLGAGGFDFDRDTFRLQSSSWRASSE